jgi:hypothetical protein
MAMVPPFSFLMDKLAFVDISNSIGILLEASGCCLNSFKNWLIVRLMLTMMKTLALMMAWMAEKGWQGAAGILSLAGDARGGQIVKRAERACVTPLLPVTREKGRPGQWT